VPATIETSVVFPQPLGPTSASSGDRRTQVPLALLLRPELAERGRGHVGLDPDGHRDAAGPAPPEFLHEDEPGGEVAARAAPPLGVVQPEEPQVAESVEQRIREVTGRLPLVHERGDLGFHESADAGAQGVVLRGGDRAGHGSAG